MSLRDASLCLDAADRCRGNAAAYDATPDPQAWGSWWRGMAEQHDAAARAVCPAADTWDPPGPVFVAEVE